MAREILDIGASRMPEMAMVDGGGKTTLWMGGSGAQCCREGWAQHEHRGEESMGCWSAQKRERRS